MIVTIEYKGTTITLRETDKGWHVITNYGLSAPYKTQAKALKDAKSFIDLM